MYKKSIELLKNGLYKEKKLVLTVRIRPNANASHITGFLADGSLKIAIAAPATDNKANTELIKLLAKEFAVAVQNIDIISGATSRQKLVRIEQ